MASFLHLAIKSANQEQQEVNSFLFLIPDESMKKVEFLRTKTLREELVLRLSLDSTCKVRVADIQEVLLMTVPVIQRHEQSRDTESAHDAHEVSTLSGHVAVQLHTVS